MNRLTLRVLLAATAVLAFAAPATAQMNHANMPGMNMPGMKMPMPAKKKSAAKKPAAKKTVAKKTPDKRATGATAKKGPAKKAAPATPRTGTKADPMAGHDMSSMPGMEMPTKPADPMAGHDMSSMPGKDMPSTKPSDPMAGHDMSSMPGMTNAPPAGTDLPAGNAPPPAAPVDHAGDAVYGASPMEMGRHHLKDFHGGQKLSQVMFNIAEAQFRKGRDGFEWDGEGWYGGDIDRLWVKSEGDGAFGRSVEKAEVQALYSRAVGPYFNLQGGVRYDFKPNPSRAYAVLAVEGLAPSFFDIEGSLFLSNRGELMARAEGWYDQRITQRLILQPRAEVNFAAQSTRKIGIGSGLSDAEIGLRLRYDIRRQFAPYVGVQYRQAFGDTRKYLREAGEDPGGWSLLTGVRMWF